MICEKMLCFCNVPEFLQKEINLNTNQPNVDFRSSRDMQCYHQQSNPQNKMYENENYSKSHGHLKVAAG